MKALKLLDEGDYTCVQDFKKNNIVYKSEFHGILYWLDEDEQKFGDQGIKEDDGYYYYLGSLSFMQRAELFSEIAFVGKEIVWEDGGHYGQLQVIVESMEANIDYIEGENRWSTAPRYWIWAMRNR